MASWGLGALGALKKSKSPQKGPLCRYGEESQRLEVVPEAVVCCNKYWSLSLVPGTEFLKPLEFPKPSPRMGLVTRKTKRVLSGNSKPYPPTSGNARGQLQIKLSYKRQQDLMSFWVDEHEEVLGVMAQRGHGSPVPLAMPCPTSFHLAVSFIINH